MKWAFMTANFVAEEAGYRDVRDWFRDWGRCHDATVDAFHSPRFEYKFESVLSRVKDAGYDAVELWVAHLLPGAATPGMISSAVRLLDKYELAVVSYTAAFHEPDMPRSEAEEAFRIAKAIGAPVLANGFHISNRPMLAELCRSYDMRFGYENHPEKSAGEVVQLIGEYAPWIGSTLDTGWFATHGVDPVKAVDELRSHLVHVHLKDIKAEGSHDSCAVGDGIVDARGVLSALLRAGYQGPITLEHEPYDGDPMPAMTRSLAFVRNEWDKLASLSS